MRGKHAEAAAHRRAVAERKATEEVSVEIGALKAELAAVRREAQRTHALEAELAIVQDEQRRQTSRSLEEARAELAETRSHLDRVENELGELRGRVRDRLLPWALRLYSVAHSDMTPTAIFDACLNEPALEGFLKDEFKGAFPPAMVKCMRRRAIKGLTKREENRLNAWRGRHT